MEQDLALVKSQSNAINMADRSTWEAIDGWLSRGLEWARDKLPTRIGRGSVVGPFLVSLYEKTEGRYETLMTALLDYQRERDRSEPDTEQLDAAARRFFRAVHGLMFLPRRKTFDKCMSWMTAMVERDAEKVKDAEREVLAAVGNDLRDLRSLIYKC